MTDIHSTGQPPALTVTPRAQLVDVQTARRRLGVGLTKFYELINTGELRTVKIGARRLISEEAIADYISRLERREQVSGSSTTGAAA